MENEPTPSEAKDPGPFYHGTKADLKPGDLLEAGYSSNYGERKQANYIYLTATLDAATWGAEPQLARYPYLAAARADLLTRLAVSTVPGSPSKRR